jgi:hypothetical protein
MGTLQLTVQKSDAEAIPYTVTIADVDIDRIASTYGALLFPQGVEVSPADPSADPPVEAVIRAPNSVEIVIAISTSLIEGMMANVLSHERQVAVEAAVAAVAPISVTPA